MFCCALGEVLQGRLTEAWHDVEKHVHITWQVTSDPSKPFLPLLFTFAFRPP